MLAYDSRCQAAAQPQHRAGKERRGLANPGILLSPRRALEIIGDKDSQGEGTRVCKQQVPSCVEGLHPHPALAASPLLRRLTGEPTALTVA